MNVKGIMADAQAVAEKLGPVEELVKEEEEPMANAEAVAEKLKAVKKEELEMEVEEEEQTAYVQDMVELTEKLKVVEPVN